MSDRFLSISLNDLRIGQGLPGNLYLYLDFRFVTFRVRDDVIDSVLLDRLQGKRVKTLFFQEADRVVFEKWIAEGQREATESAVPVEMKIPALEAAREDAHRKTLDIFQNHHDNKTVTQFIGVSKKLVSEVMKQPYAVKSLTQLQTFSRGTVDHSLNVSILSTYLAMQMGYSHNLILQHVGMGALLHDVGKSKIDFDESDSVQTVRLKMLDHPIIGVQFLESLGGVPAEVKMIVAQHHENHDGSGYPKKLRGSAIYDLARIVIIANAFDEAVVEASGTLPERQKKAIQRIDQIEYKKFDPQKLDKALKILKLGV